MSFISDSNEIASKLRGARKSKTNPEAPEGPFMKLAEILRVIPLSKTQLYVQMQAGTFPRPLKLGARTTVWRRTDVAAWIAEKLG